MNMPYFSMKTTDNTADIYIFGDIVADGWKWAESDYSATDLVSQIKALPSDAAITVHINSNGGDLKEGLGIYNELKGRNVTTICEGFAASSASVIFCAGKKRIMNAASLLFIHNASTYAAGTADEFEKTADDLRIITAAAKAAYKEAGVNISDEKLAELMDEETWLTPQDAMDMGFATEIMDIDEDGIKNDAMQSIINAVTGHRATESEPTLKSISEQITALYGAVKALNEGDTEAAELAEDAEPAEEPVEEEAQEQDAETLAEDATIPTPEPAQVEDMKKGFFGF